MGDRYSIFRAATIGRLALLLQHDGSRAYVSDELWQIYWRRAKEFFIRYYDAYEHRFPTIRHPLECNIPLGIEGVDEPPVVEYSEGLPWESLKWKEWREEMARNEFGRMPML